MLHSHPMNHYPARKGEAPSNRVSLDGVWKFKLLDSVNDLTSEILEEDLGVLTGVISKCQWELGQGKSRKINPITRILLCHGLATSLPMCQTITQPVFIKSVINLSASSISDMCILHIGSAESIVLVFCNSVFIGLGKDSRLPSEFNLTPYLREGENVLNTGHPQVE